MKTAISMAKSPKTIQNKEKSKQYLYRDFGYF